MPRHEGPVKRRLFVGTFLPDEDKRRLGELIQYRERLAEDWQRKIRFVRQDKLHLTWLFLGHVEEKYIDVINERLARIAAQQAALELTYDTPSFWPSAKHASMLVLTPSVVPDGMRELAAEVKNELREFVQKDDHPTYRPHISLIRMEPGRRATLQVPPWFPLSERLPIRHHIQQFDLIESHLGAGKDAYISLTDFAFR